MKLYLSSVRIPTPVDLTLLLGKSLSETSVALIPNAKDYYSERARNYKIADLETYMKQLGLKAEVVDLRGYSEPATLKQKLSGYDLIWAIGGNTYVLRFEMRRSGFEYIIQELLQDGIVYGGDSAGALVAGLSIDGVELADEPQFAEAVIQEGLGIVPFVILPHSDNAAFTDASAVVRSLHQGKRDIIELKDNQAVLFDGSNHWFSERKE